ncbi:MAG: GNAT family N-acetyltransferase [Acidimicrobiia bacterium]
MPLLRPVSVGDAAQIAAIYEPLVRDNAVSFELEPPGPAEMRGRIETVTASHPWLVAEDGGAVLGYAYATSFRQRPAYRWSVETTVYVHPEHHRRGVGRPLYSALLDLATMWGFATAYVGIALPTLPARRCTLLSGSPRSGCFPGRGTSWGSGTTWRGGIAL